MSAGRHPGYVPEYPDAAMARATERVSFGFWVFLMSDAVLFALLFATYGVLFGGSDPGPGAAEVIVLTYAFPETLLLLASTLSYGMATVAQAHDGPWPVAGWLGLTLALGAGFLALEFTEFAGMIARGEVPQRNAYLSALFALVGTHGLHVGFGILWGGVLLVQLAVKGLDARVRSRLVRLGLYWHLLDVVWVAIISVVYLPGVLV